MKSIAEAHREMLPHFEVLPPVRTPLLSALGQVLAEDLLAAGDLPPFDNSAMDGYAVRHDEVSEASSCPSWARRAPAERRHRRSGPAPRCAFSPARPCPRAPTRW